MTKNTEWAVKKDTLFGWASEKMSSLLVVKLPLLTYCSQSLIGVLVPWCHKANEVIGKASDWQEVAMATWAAVTLSPQWINFRKGWVGQKQK